MAGWLLLAEFDLSMSSRVIVCHVFRPLYILYINTIISAPAIACE